MKHTAKKWLALLLAAMMLLSLVACAGNEDKNNGADNDNTQQIEHKTPSHLFIKKGRHQYIVVYKKQDYGRQQKAPKCHKFINCGHKGIILVERTLDERAKEW